MSHSALLISWLPGVIYLIAAAVAASGSDESAWRRAEAGTLVALATALLGLGMAIGEPAPDWLGLLMGAMVAFLGWVVVRFSATYLTGEAGQARYRVALLLTLAAILCVIAARNLGVLVLAWLASSLCLHHLLTFYRNRRPALLAAHKKFVLSRLAELLLAAALVLLYRQTGSLDFHLLQQGLSAEPSSAAVAAMLMLAGAVLLKSAQLPLHGWLIQVMEAPTPVSALLHAGVVNLGGFVLLRLSFLLDGVPAAQYLLVAFGGTTAALAGLVMLTQNSVKVRLAWSTCAQMGFMLLEIGLGLYALAMLHLLAHSLYKAHAFLTAGETVAEARWQRLFARAPGVQRQGGILGRMALGVVALLGVTGLSLLLRRQVGLHIDPLAMLILALALAPMLWSSRIHWAGGAALLVLLTAGYALLHVLASGVIPDVENRPQGLLFAVAAGAALLYWLQAGLFARPAGAWLRRLYPWLHSGFFLDEFFTRLVFRFWPSRRQAATSAVHTGEMQGDQA